MGGTGEGTPALSSRIAALRVHAERLSGHPIRTLVSADPGRSAALSVSAGPLHASFARQRYDGRALDELFGLASSAGLDAALRALAGGEQVNPTEGRPALHTALRARDAATPAAREAVQLARAARARMAELVRGIQQAGITDVVSVGIGGSDLGPRLVVDALVQPGPGLPRVHFLSNVDPAAAASVTAGLDPARTAVILVSKSFGTQETLLNGRILADWLGDGSRLYAVSANPGRAAETFDIDPSRVLPMWDWVGGRYSMWSAVGFPIAIALGMERFEALLGGAAEMDEHVLSAPLRENIAAWHALTAVWNRNALGLHSHAVVPYAERLRLLPAYLQQLVMESLGKSVRADGSPVGLDTVPVWWGGTGTDVQHSFFQALHQGTGVASMDFIGVIDPGIAGHDDNAHALLANLLAQSEALANGQDSDDPHRAYAGNRPNTVLLLDRLDARSLGALVAMYEHSVYLQGVLWGINPFDQFGVELGKQVANRLLPALKGDGEAGDPVTHDLIARIRRAQ